MKWIFLYLFIIILSGCNSNPLPELTMVAHTQVGGTGSSLVPNLLVDGADNISMSYVLRLDDTAMLFYTRWENDNWSRPVQVATGNNWFINWADYPGIAVGDENHLLAWFLQKSDTGTFTYDVMITTSNNGGQSWQKPVVLHNDSVKAEHGFVSCATSNNEYLISWLDGRNTASSDEHAAHGHGGNMTLRFASLDLSGKIIREWEADNKVCDCCQTATAATDDGAVVVYRNRTDEEIRDIHVLRMQNNEWLPDASLHEQQWKTDACPVNGPAIAAKKNQIAVAYFGAPAMKPSVHVKFSNDGGTSFGEAIRIDNGSPLGRVDVAWLNTDYAAVTWMEAGKVWLRVIHVSGTQTEPLMVAALAQTRATGFPQLAVAKGQLIVAVTNPAKKVIDTYYYRY